MDPKLAQKLDKAINELEGKITPLKTLSNLGNSLETANSSIGSATEQLTKSAASFPEALESLRNVSGLLKEAIQTVNESNPDHITESINQLGTKLNGNHETLLQSIRSQSLPLIEKIDTSSRNAVREITKEVEKSSVGIADHVTSISNDITEIKSEVDRSLSNISELVNQSAAGTRKILLTCTTIIVISVVVGTTTAVYLAQL